MKETTKPTELFGLMPKRWFDKNGLIVTASGNGGDSAARMGLWMVSSWTLYTLGHLNRDQWLLIRSGFRKALKLLMPYSGVFIRHPKRSKDWDQPGVRDFARWNDWQVFSRDQTLPMLCGLMLAEENGILEYAIKGLKRRHGTCQNGDLLGPSHWALLIRIANVKSGFKYLGVLDAFLFAGMVITAIKRDASDSINGFLMMVMSCIRPTLFSRLTIWFAGRFMNYQALFNEYFDNNIERSAPFHEYCKPIFQELFHGDKKKFRSKQVPGR